MRLDEVANCHPITLEHIEGGTRGALTVAEYGGVIPFDFRRVYYMTGIADPGAVRGRHAHKTLQQALFCINGSVHLDVDDGTHKASVVLDQPHEGAYIGPLLWHELHDFKPGCVVLVFAAAAYDEADYLRDYDEFLSYVKAQRP
ncbi:MAG TPA: FdtA/QdtA family cupin domain-containing protein [Dehalococcoidia bacterium]|nr:FdtA/QdtA family cupin domain-containing protein [Dehalococcoidia bacterium]